MLLTLPRGTASRMYSSTCVRNSERYSSSSICQSADLFLRNVNTRLAKGVSELKRQHGAPLEVMLERKDYCAILAHGNGVCMSQDSEIQQARWSVSVKGGPTTSSMQIPQFVQTLNFSQLPVCMLVQTRRELLTESRTLQAVLSAYSVLSVWVS